MTLLVPPLSPKRSLKKILPVKFLVLVTFCLLGTQAFAFQTPNPNLVATGSVEVAFSPEQDTAGIIIKAINQAKKQILVQAFSFTHKDIAQALIAAYRRGVEVKLIADLEQSEHENDKVAQIAQAKIPVWLDGEHQSAHNKVMLIDVDMPQVVIITGSYNFTFAAQFKNAENVLLIRGNAKLAELYKQNWLRHQAHSQMLHP
ncbi:MAG: phospholipase D family protein [Methylophilales bacterium]|nr:phospholipase D family protein [Methylophilales bacterium]